MINSSCFSLEMMSSARSIAQASAVKIELSIGRAFYGLFCVLNTHTVLLLSLEPSVKIYR